MYFAGFFTTGVQFQCIVWTTDITSIIFTLCFPFQARFVFIKVKLSVYMCQKAFSFSCSEYD